MVQKIALPAPRPSRGRPRDYDPDEALTRATEAFWKAGYSATSLDALSEAMDMNRPSLYGAFGDKRALYLQAMGRYIERSRAAMDAALGYGRPLPEALNGFYRHVLDLYLSGKGGARGCFLTGTAATEAVSDPEVRAKLGAGLRTLTRAFEARLKHAQSRGELGRAADTAALADIGSAVMHSLSVRARAGDSRAALKATAEAAVQLICGSPTKKPRKRGQSAHGVVALKRS